MRVVIDSTEHHLEHYNLGMSRVDEIEDAIEDIRKGKMIILVDDEDRENEGDLVIAADKVTPKALNFMACHARGLICIALAQERVEALGLSPMTSRNRAPLGTAFTVSVDANSTTLGFSAHDRAETVLALMSETATRKDFRIPGHSFPLSARPGGVLVRPGQTEGSVDLARLAGLRSGAVICEIMNDDGSMMRLDDLLAFGREHDMKVVTVADLIAYRMRKESFVQPVAETLLPTDYGEFRAIAFENELDDHVHLALVKGTLRADTPTLVRVHRGDLLADVFGHSPNNSGNRLEMALSKLSKADSGVILYLRSSLNGEMAIDSMRYQLAKTQGKAPKQHTGHMNFREFGIGAQILSNLGLRKLRIMANNPFPLTAASGFGLEVVEWVPITA
jgi:3,4-dihydroxy 2-butanone 4-phosphate synthase/GTP cyclohydrolase II